MWGRISRKNLWGQTIAPANLSRVIFYNGAYWSIPKHDDPRMGSQKDGYCPEVKQGFDGTWNSYPLTSVVNYMKKWGPVDSLEKKYFDN